MSYKKSSRKNPSRLVMSARLCIPPGNFLRGVAAVAACFIVAPALSNPVNPVVVNGAASFNQAGNVLTVTNSNGAIINWDKFSIKAGETTRFEQTSASSSVLNRVLNDPSSIYGTLSSNGRVWLVNPAGIMVGPGGRVDTAAFVASTLNIRNEDFLAGRHLFINDGSAKDVVNQGSITTPAGGSVYLIGSNVSNEGIITTPQGETILAAGATVSLIDSATPGVKVDITGAAGNATNLGTITAEAGRIGIAGVIVRNSGTLNASSVVSEGGRIFLKASQDAYVDGNGRIVTTGTKGGSVEVLGNRVAVMDDAGIDASGADGGGRIMIGGDYQGKNPDIQNASITYFGPNASFKADATGVGDGGTVIVWADDTTRAYGNISARGGANGGDGGFVETSGHRYLDVAGVRVSAAAPNGTAGQWLLDPNDIQIVHNGTDLKISGATPFAPTQSDASVSILSDNTINTAIYGGTSVTIQTASVYGGNGDIIFDGISGGPIVINHTAAAATTLSLNADRNIQFKGTTTFETTGGSTGLTVAMIPGASGKVTSYGVDSAVVNLYGGAGHMEVQLNGGSKTWENSGTINLSGDSTIRIFDNSTVHSTLWNQAFGTVNLNSTNQWSFLSNNTSQNGIITNDCTINVNTATSWEAIYSQGSGGILNISSSLSMQNANVISGAVNISAGASLRLSETHSGARSFSGTTITGPGWVDTVGGVTAFSGVTLNNAMLVNSYGGLIVPAGITTYIGNVGYVANDFLGAPKNTTIVTSGNITLVAGWDGITAPPSLSGTTDATGLAGNTGNLDFIHGNTVVAAGGSMTLKAASYISLTGDVYGGVSISSGGAQSVYTPSYLQVAGSSAVYGGNAELRSGSTQTITANQINVKAGSGTGIHDSRASIIAYGDQQITVGTMAAGGINIWSDTVPSDPNSYNNEASIRHGDWGGGSFSGNQTVTLGSAYGSLLSIVGGAGSGTSGFTDNECLSGCAGAHNEARLQNYFGNMTINTPVAGSSISVTGGTVGNNNGAGIESQTSGTLTVGTSGATAPSIAIAGGASGGSLGVKTPAYGGGVYYNSNDGTISSDGTLIVNASTVSLTASTAAYGAAFLGGANVTVNTAGNVTLTGGSGNSGVDATLSTPVAIGSDKATSVVLNVGGNLILTGGAGNGAMAMIGSLFGTADVVINGQHGITFNSATTGADRIGSLPGLGGSIALSSGLGGTGSMSLNKGLIKTGGTGSVMLQANGTGSGISQDPLGQIITPVLNVDAPTGPGVITLVGTQNSVGLLNASTANGNFSFAGDQITIGSISATGTGRTATINTQYAILDDTISSTRIVAANIDLTSTLGGAANGLAISADTEGTNINATVPVTAAHGGISIRNYGAATPSSINFYDWASADNRIAFLHSGSDLVLDGSHRFEVYHGGDLAIFAGSNIALNSGPLTNLPSSASSVLLGANGNMDFNGPFALPNNNLGLVAGSALAINGGVSAKNIAAVASVISGTGSLTATNDAIVIGTSAINIGSGISVSGANVFLGGGTLNLLGSYVSATNNVEFNVGSVNGTGGYIYAGHDIIGIVSGNMALGSGSYFEAIHDVNLSFTGASSTLSLSGGGYLLADAFTTINLTFAARSSGGVTINGVETTTSLPGGSGLFAGSISTPATEGAGLHLVYSMADLSQDLCSINPTLCKPPDPGDNPVNQDALPKIETARNDPGQGTGGKDDSFGGDEGGKDKKDDKDKDKQKSDEGKEGNKDEKQGKKHVAQCT